MKKRLIILMFVFTKPESLSNQLQASSKSRPIVLEECWASVAVSEALEVDAVIQPLPRTQRLHHRVFNHITGTDLKSRGGREGGAEGANAPSVFHAFYQLSQKIDPKLSKIGSFQGYCPPVFVLPLQFLRHCNASEVPLRPNISLERDRSLIPEASAP